MWTSLTNISIACEIVDVVCAECTLMCVRTFIAIYISRTYISHTFSFLLIFTTSFQVATHIFDTTVVNVSIDTNYIISRQGTSVSPVEPFAFIYGTIDNSLQALQREINNLFVESKFCFNILLLNSLNIETLQIEFFFYSYICN